MRLTRQQHLRHAGEFLALRQSGLRRDSRFFSLNFLLLPERQPPLRRVGVIASRRLGNAVQRNHAKRRMRELFRLHQERLPSSFDLVMVARRALLTAPFYALQDDFLRLLDNFQKQSK